THQQDFVFRSFSGRCGAHWTLADTRRLVARRALLAVAACVSSFAATALVAAPCLTDHAAQFIPALGICPALRIVITVIGVGLALIDSTIFVGIFITVTDPAVIGVPVQNSCSRVAFIGISATALRTWVDVV